MTAIPSTWSEVFRFSVQLKGGTAYEWGGMIEEISAIDHGDKDFESVATAIGGRLIKFTPQGDESMTLKVWPLNAKVGTAGVAQFFNPQATPDATDPILVENTRIRNRHQLIFIVAEDVVSMASAGSATTAGAAAKRMVAKNAYLTSFKPDMSDKALSAEVTFKWTPFDETGTSNCKWESTDGGSVLTAVTSYT